MENIEEKKESKGKIVLDYIIKTMNGMAYGLFSTLIIGTIIGTIGGFFNVDSYIYKVLTSVATLLKNLTGIGIGLGIGLSLKFDGLKLISIGAAGGIATFMAGTWSVVDGVIDHFNYTNFGFKIGDPLTVYVVVVAVCLLIPLVLRKKTPVDIIIVPLFTIVASLVTTLLICMPISWLTTVVGAFINKATELHPFIMGIIIAVLMGMALTAPISSAAIAASFGITGLAGGAAVVGCCVQMLGFAVMSRKDNKIGTVISIGIGTSMLQFKNIVRKPIIWLPTIIVSAILGPITTCAFKTLCVPSGAGMGTSGLVGIFGVINEGAMGSSLSVWLLNVGLGLVVLPIVLVYIVDFVFRRFNLIKEGDLVV